MQPRPCGGPASVVHAAAGLPPRCREPDRDVRPDRHKAVRPADGRPASGTQALGGRGDLHHAGAGLAGHGDRQYRPPRHRGRPPCQRGRRGLGRQRLSNRIGRDPVAARRARRNRRPRAYLYRRRLAVYAGLARLRPGVVVAQPDRGAGAARARRKRHHERQRRAGAFCLSDTDDGPRLRPQCAGGRNRDDAGTDDRVRRPRGRKLAMAVRHQLAVRRDRCRDWPEDPAKDAARTCTHSTL